jgi:hypothetical protein
LYLEKSATTDASKELLPKGFTAPKMLLEDEGSATPQLSFPVLPPEHIQHVIDVSRLEMTACGPVPG